MKKAINKTKNRIWEIDALRGLLVICILICHLYYCVDAFCIEGIYNINPYNYVNITDPLHFWFDWGEDGVIFRSFLTPQIIEIWRQLGIGCLFVLSGISTNFSRSSIKGIIRLLCGAAFLSLFTWLLVLYTGDKDQFIRFGALHCYAVCHIIYCFLLENKSNKLLLPIALGSLLVGYYLYFRPIYTNSALLIPFGFYEYGVVMRDYLPVFPMLGWLLIGVVMGRYRYKDKKTRFPNLQNQKWHRPLRFLGRHSGLIYCGHMVVYTVVFCGIGYIFHLY